MQPLDPRYNPTLFDYAVEENERRQRTEALYRKYPDLPAFQRDAETLARRNLTTEARLQLIGKWLCRLSGEQAASIMKPLAGFLSAAEANRGQGATIFCRRPVLPHDTDTGRPKAWSHEAVACTLADAPIGITGYSAVRLTVPIREGGRAYSVPDRRSKLSVSECMATATPVTLRTTELYIGAALLASFQEADSHADRVMNVVPLQA